MHVLYHLHSLMVSDSVELSSFAAIAYEKFLLGVVGALLTGQTLFFIDVRPTHLRFSLVGKIFAGCSASNRQIL